MRSAFTILRGAALIGALTLGFPAAAFAASSGSGENTPLHLASSAAQHTSSSVGSGSILRTIVALVIVVGLIYGIARVLKKVKGSDQRATGDGLQHVATLPLAQGRSVALVRSGSDVVLIGISESGVTPIKVYSESEALMTGIALPPADQDEPVLLLESGERKPQRNLMDLLRQMTVRV
ncbi:MAG TPA: flagellar biosynthetic protein FliO [Solirubrobacteraceae bacterium]|nr:flagellar biosynthetic protein FliO [Solirubrobacteraceae bacterium]